MANYTFNWSNGVTTSIPKPQEQGFHCDYESPSSTMNNAANEIIAHAGDGADGSGQSNLHEKEAYCLAAWDWILSLESVSSTIKNTWASKRDWCDDWDEWWRIESCGCCMDWCYLNWNELNSAYYNWKDIQTANQNALVTIENTLQETRDQIELDGEQAMDQAILDQMIAQTNEMISTTAYNNESRELDVAAKKTQKIFIPVLIGLILLGVGFIFLKK